MSADAVSEHASNLSTTYAQRRIVGLCILFNVIDGLDVMAMAFTAASVSAEWALTGTQTGLLLSSGLVGMACGSVYAPSMALRQGRRTLLIASLILSAVGMLISYLSEAFGSLLCSRVITGVGVGMMLVLANVLTYESARASQRKLAVALQSMAFAMGALLCGVLAHFLNDTVGWRYVFFSGCCITFCAAVVAEFRLRKSGHCYVLMLEAPEALRGGALQPMMRTSSYALLFSKDQWRETASLASAFFLLMFGFYFVMSWTPTLLVQSGLYEQGGVAGGVLLNMGGMLGALIIGLSANRFGCRRLLTTCLIFGAVMMGSMVQLTQVAELAIPVGVLAGMLLNGAVAAMYNLTPQAFPDSLRICGVGLVVATARLGAILSPAVAGSLLDGGWSIEGLFTFYAGSQLLASLMLWITSSRGEP